MAGLFLQPKGLKSYGRYGAVGIELLASIAVGYYVGHWLDGKFGTHWIALVGFLLGCYAGFRALFVVAGQMQRDIEREEKLEQGGDPWADEYPAPDGTDTATKPKGETS
jgi:F0F1-type ATP synthase assembly protein I